MNLSSVTFYSIIHTVAAIFPGSMLDMMDYAGMTGRSWDAWRTFWRAVFGLPMSRTDLLRYRTHTARTHRPRKPFREVWMPIGRGGGKSWNVALAATYLAISRDYTLDLPPGGQALIPIIGSDRHQARIVLGYIKGLTDLETFAPFVEGKMLAESVPFTTGVRIEIMSASYRAVRGYAIPALICDEIAFWDSDDSAEPDSEILNAARPGMGRIRDARLFALSSPYARRGELYRAVRESYGVEDARTLVWNADTLSMNPAYPDKELIELAFADDPAKAISEYGTDGHVQFRSDIEAFISAEAINAATVQGRRELMPSEGVRYYAFTDPSGGSMDSWTLAIAHVEDGKTIQDRLIEWRPPFSPAHVVGEAADILKSYRITEVEGDHYGGEFPRELFRKHSIQYRTAKVPKADLYREFGAAVHTGRVALLDHRRLQSQLVALERRTTRAGDDSIDHPPGGHDDLSNATAGACTRAARKDGLQVAVLRLAI